MKICTVRIERRLLRYRSPISTAHGPVNDRWTVLLSLEDEDGHTGLGEAAPLAGFTSDTVDDAEAALHRWASDDSNGSLPAGSPTARAAVDSALLDLAAQVAGTSVHRLLAPDSPDRVAVAALVTGTTPDDVAASAAEAAASGHTTVKVKVGVGGIDADLDRVAAVRERVGTSVRIRLDANGAWSASEALRGLERLSIYSPEFVEEPVAGLEALAVLRSASPVPIAVDESASSPEKVARAVSLGAADLVVLKPSALGGPSASAEAAARARNAGVDVVVTSLLEGSVGIRAAAHLASAIGALDPLPGLATADLLADDISTPCRPVGGTLYLGTDGVGPVID